MEVGGYVVLDGGGSCPPGPGSRLDLDRQLGTELALPTRAGGAPGVQDHGPDPVRARRGHDPRRWLAPFHDALVRVATGAEVQAWLQRSERPHAKLRLGELALAAGVPCLADAGGLRPAYLPLRSVGVGQDLLTRGDPGAPADRDRPAPGGAGPELGLRAAGRFAPTPIRPWPGATGEAARAGRGLLRRRPGRAEAPAARGRDRSGGAGRPAPAGPDRGPRGVRRAGGAARQRGPAHARGADRTASRPEARRLGLRVRNLGVDRFTVWAPGEAGSVLDAVHDQGLAVSSSTWARCPRARSSRSWPERCSATCGGDGTSAARC